MEEKYLSLEKANIFESSKKHLMKFIESLVTRYFFRNNLKIALSENLMRWSLTY